MIIYLSLLIVFIILFRFFPEIDIKFSKLFFNTKLISFEKNSYIDISCQIITIFGFILILIIISYFLFAIKYKNKKSFHHSIYLGLALFIVPILLNHIIFKSIFHRPRPYDIIEFGGKLNFTKAWDIKGECMDKCSFPSSHASLGYFLYSFIWIIDSKLKKKINHKNILDKLYRKNNFIFKFILYIRLYIFRFFNKKNIFYIATFLGTIFGGIRIAMGYHFLSDVIFSGFITFGIIYLINITTINFFK
ncbi:phosphatase PAP2 family protein [Lyticum sinuosum]|uniref:PAP2 superfamily protein n=1 Tax=Lyticum sinuosum TaxID=1332059 RepID=A0AAE4VKY9_9RICK|nr:phosphatase PAP2 family protein [Lyticum sinuosum]MDZ5760957.1 PAP2 superfamily protein [Lyticum sinuosum]